MRWRRIAFACATVLLFLATAVLLLLPAIAERVIVARLTSLGLEDVALEVADLSFDRIRLADVRIGERFGIERAEVTFELRPPRMRMARVSGVRWEIGTTTSGLDLAPFDRLRPSQEKAQLPFERIEIESARLSLPSAGAHADLSASLDSNGLTRLHLQGAAGTLELGGRKLEQLAMSATSTDGRSIQWNVEGRNDGLSLALEGIARIQVDPPRAEFDFVVTAGGDLGFASLGLDDLRARARITAKVDQETLVASLLEGEATTAAASWESTRFTSVRAVVPKQELLSMRFGETPELSIPLRLSWKGLRTGNTDLGRGSASLRIDGLRTVQLQRAETHLEEGGTLWVGPTRFELGAKQIGFDLVIDHVAMKRWLDAVARGKVEGEGRLSGRVPVRIAFEPLRIRLGRGELFAKPGAVLRVTDLKTAEAWIGQAMLGTDLASVVKKRLLEALQELELDELEFRFEPQGNDVDLTVHLAGRGVRGARQEIGGLTVNFHNFGAGLNQVLRAQEEMKHDPILELFQ